MIGPRPSIFRLGWACLLLCGACVQPALRPAELPAHPVAITYWEPEPARRRIEILQREQAKSLRGRRSRRGIADFNRLAARLGRGDDPESVERALARFPGRLVLLDARTREIQPLESAPRDARALSWSRDRERLLFVSDHIGGRGQLYELHRSSGEVRPLTRGRLHVVDGDFAPDGRLAYSAVELRDGRPNPVLIVTEPAGVRPEILDRGIFAEGIRWSPDGTWLVYSRGPRADAGESSQSGSPSPLLVVRDAVPGSPERVLGRGRDPVILADGSWILYSARVRGHWRLRRVRPDGFARAPVGESVRDEFSPAVSPDGQHVVYVGQERSVAQLWVRRLDGSGDRLLLDAGAASWPVW